MVQRKDSFSFVEFMRGKYDIGNMQYIKKLYSTMTDRERKLLLTQTFSWLWHDMWQSSVSGGSNGGGSNGGGSNGSGSFAKEYADAKTKYEMLRGGYTIRAAGTGTPEFLDLSYLYKNTTTALLEPEWGFPKGRRNINENDAACAMREFREETGVDPAHVTILSQTKPFDEVFSGSNSVRYKHVYYIAQCLCPPQETARFDPDDKVQAREIRQVRWMDFDTAMSHISLANQERREMFERAAATIQKVLS
ncbi:hypothetical protein FOA52_004173 [Chlamydomonas sp. UWO 241]|nr:hypothetical protein FOA52_004173 [Chlamydomonas sp. UWO 241]